MGDNLIWWRKIDANINLLTIVTKVEQGSLTYLPSFDSKRRDNRINDASGEVRIGVRESMVHG